MENKPLFETTEVEILFTVRVYYAYLAGYANLETVLSKDDIPDNRFVVIRLAVCIGINHRMQGHGPSPIAPLIRHLKDVYDIEIEDKLEEVKPDGR